MPDRYYALWRNRNGQQLWDGPYPTNGRAASRLEQIIDTSGGSLVVRSMTAMTPGERLEGLPITDNWAISPEGKD